MVFTDIEGSTNLLDRIGEAAYVDALAEHRRVLRAAFSEQGGFEVDTQGDAFFYVFSDARAALTAVVAGHDLLEPGDVRVRVGVHSGEVVATPEGYAGREVHRAARIAASGHGGQTVVSAVTRQLVDGMFEGVLTSLGDHRLKDFDEPMELFQISVGEFPPLRTISNTNLPSPVSPFVGRAQERDKLVGLLTDGRQRIVTMTGPGGTGKTRLAIEVGSELVPRFTGGVFWVGLAALRDPALVTETIAGTVGVGAGDDLATWIGAKHVLLVLDNLEQVIEAAPDLADLASRCPHLALMTTSREVMRVPGEVEFAVPPLAANDAVALFCERARLAPDATVEELCDRLDRMPLALEMAAARASVMSPAQILDRLGQRLDLLKAGRGVDPRQQTLRATIEWSYDLLDPDQRSLFARLAVFRGGCTLEAAELIADADLDVVQSLVDKSLLRHAGERFSMLETIRQFAWERLTDRGELSELSHRHALGILDLCEDLIRARDDGRADSHVLNARLEEEYDNIRAALEWARDSGEPELLLRLAALVASWRSSSHVQDAERWLPLALERSQTPVTARLVVLRGMSMVYADRGDYARSDHLSEELQRTAEGLGDEEMALRAQNIRGVNAFEQGDVGRARTEFRSVLRAAQRAGLAGMTSTAVLNLACVEWLAGDYDEGLRLSHRALELSERERDTHGQAFAWDNAASCHLALGDDSTAATAFARAVELFAKNRDTQGQFTSLCGLSQALVARGDYADAARVLGGAEKLSRSLLKRFQTDKQSRAYDETVGTVRLALDEDGFSAEWNRGAALDLGELLAMVSALTKHLDPHA